MEHLLRSVQIVTEAGKPFFWSTGDRIKNIDQVIVDVEDDLPSVILCKAVRLTTVQSDNCLLYYS
jgi:hypothetical protein